MKITDYLASYAEPRTFAAREIPAAHVQALLSAALLSEGCRGRNTCELYVTDDRARLDRLADVRDDSGAESLRTAPLAAAVVADRLYDGTWAENCAAVVWAVRLQAAELGIACSSVQIRGYSLTDGELSDDAVRGILDVPEGKTVYALLVLGYGGSMRAAADGEEPDWGRVHLV